ncbi:hypothetical protein [Spirulina major]|uniref:hypothetical protein n=1 Tax=Spirulina major TaxID=270636 RepID=UPI0009334262|nr:hypothetical protein [Spirulina major]
MKHPRPLHDRERMLMVWYRHCQREMSPQAFYQKWAVTYEEMAELCDRSLSTVRGWFRSGSYHRFPRPHDCQHLALMDWLWEHFETVPPEVWQRLCPGQDDLFRGERSP